MKKPVRHINIKLDKTPVFAGRLVSGSLEFFLKDNTNVKSIILIFQGSSKTCWPGDGSAGDGNEQWFYRVEIPCTSYLFQYSLKNDVIGKYKVPAGHHSVPFGFPIPPYAPSSFGGRFGYVYHCCKAKILTCGAINQPAFRCEKPIPVIGIEDLNWYPQAALPLSWHEGYRKRVCLFRKADFSAVLRLPRTGFVPGESVTVNVEVTNRHSTRKVNKVSVELLQTVYYRCGSREKTTHTVLAQITKNEVAPGQVLIMDDEPLKIPNTPPSFLRGCDDITIHYDLHFVVEPGLKVRTPIIIGTTPFNAQSLNKFAKALPWRKSGRPPVPPKPNKFSFPHPPPLVHGHLVSPPLVNGHVASNMRAQSHVPPPLFTNGFVPHNPFDRVPKIHRPSPFGPSFSSHMNQFRRYDDVDDDKHVLKIEEIE